MRRAITNRLWVFTYQLEESRQLYAGKRQLWRQAATCLVLSLMRLAGALV